MNFNILAPTFASLLFGALSLLIIALLSGADWKRLGHWCRVWIDQNTTIEDRRFWRNVGRMAYLYLLIYAGLVR